jgi:hypothetical protein
MHPSPTLPQAATSTPTSAPSSRPSTDVASDAAPAPSAAAQAGGAEQPAWAWPEHVWRDKVNHVRAGRPMKPARWKNGARCAVALSFDSDHETNELRDGGKSFGRMSQGQYGNRQGVPRILRALAKHDAKATFFVPAVAALLYEDEQRRVVAEGHEVGIHGWIHELNSQLPYAVERDLMFRAADTLGARLRCAPCGHAHTLVGLQPRHAAHRT